MGRSLGGRRVVLGRDDDETDLVDRFQLVCDFAFLCEEEQVALLHADRVVFSECKERCGRGDGMRCKLGSNDRGVAQGPDVFDTEASGLGFVDLKEKRHLQTRWLVHPF